MQVDRFELPVALMFARVEQTRIGIRGSDPGLYRTTELSQSGVQVTDEKVKENRLNKYLSELLQVNRFGFIPY